MTSRYDQFQEFRTRLNERILGKPASAAPPGSPAENAAPAERQGGSGTLVTKRFFALDDQTYRPGALDRKTKELLGLSASLVLRCDDCVSYHIDQAVKAGASDQEIWETFDVGLIVGGSIVIPHLRRGVEFLDECRKRA
jgi:AhpD family alkylhydroperoxidase